MKLIALNWLNEKKLPLLEVQQRAGMKYRSKDADEHRKLINQCILI